MESHSFGELLTCFYEIDNNIIIANSLTINLNLADYKIESVFNKTQNNNGAKIIKSKLSKDQTKSYFCYINNNNNCDCLTYTILTNEWSDSTNYINTCLSKPTSLIFDYYDVSNEYFLYCFESDSKINIVKLNENFLITSKYNNDTYKSFEGCSQQFLSNLVYNSNDIRIFRVCNDDLKNILIGEFADLLPTTIITTIITTFPKTTILTALPETTVLTKIDETTILATLFETTVLTPLNIIETTIPVNMILIPTSLPLKTIISTILILPHNLISSTNLFIESNLENLINLLSTTPFVDNKGENKEIIIIQENINKPKEDILNNLDNAMLEYEINKIYEIFGDDYNIKISPINTNSYKNISNYIDFSNCEKILREKNGFSPSSILTVY